MARFKPVQNGLICYLSISPGRLFQAVSNTGCAISSIMNWKWLILSLPGWQTTLFEWFELHLPSARGRTRVLAVMLHPRDAKELVIPEPPAKVK